jgi:hypothetical protein
MNNFRKLKLFLLIVLFCHSSIAQKTKNQPASSQPVGKAQLTPIIDTSSHSLSEISVKAFGAVGDGRHDDIVAFETARDYVITHPAILVVPIGNYFISRPLLLQYVVNGVNKYFTIHLRGILPNKSASATFLSNIICGYKSGYGIGMQFGRGIVIENITITGQYMLPYRVTNQNIGTLRFSDWIDHSITDTRNNPYAGISIDPNLNQGGTRGGTSDVTIRNCGIIQWMVGIALSANGFTQNAEIINIVDDQFQACRVAIAIGQDQSKTVKIEGLKIWASCHTVVDGLHYGAGLGGGSVFCDNWNIAGNCNELFYITTGRFSLSARRIYSESVFRIGTVQGSAGANFRDCEIDFLTGPGLPAADYLFYGNANFDGGCIRYYDDSYNHRMNWSNTEVMFRDMTLNNPPILNGLYGIPTNHYPKPRLENVRMFYTTAKDTLIKFSFIPAISINKSTWTGTITSSGLRVGDYILGSPTNKNGRYWDQELNAHACATIQIGRVTAVNGNTASLDDVGLNADMASDYDAVYISRLK